MCVCDLHVTTKEKAVKTKFVFDLRSGTMYNVYVMYFLPPPKNKLKVRCGYGYNMYNIIRI